MEVPLETFVKELTDSGIISPGKLEDFIPPKASPKDAQELARQLVQSKQLTDYQVQEIYKGRAKSLILGNYTILDKIGAGGMGQVFKAEHRRMDRIVAIKMLPAAMTEDATASARFEREVKAAAKLFHPNIVPALDADQANGVHFLVMEYVEGRDLSALVKKDGPCPVAKAVNYILQAARGLEFAHGEGVIHRDIKPANLLLDKKGTVRILDMGLARISGGGNAAPQAELTGTGAVMGTVDYMSPEQALNTKQADSRADIYSLGCSLYYLLTGRPTYDCDTVTAKLIAHQFHPIPELRKARDGVSDCLEAVFQKMVAKKVDERYQTMTEVAADLERCQSGATSPSSSATISRLSSSATEESEMTVAFGNSRLQSIAPVEPYVEPAGTGPPRKNIKLLAGAGAAGFLFMLLGVIVYVYNSRGEKVAEIKVESTDKVPISVPPGGSIAVQNVVDPPPAPALLPPAKGAGTDAAKRWSRPDEGALAARPPSSNSTARARTSRCRSGSTPATRRSRSKAGLTSPARTLRTTRARIC